VSSLQASKSSLTTRLSVSTTTIANLTLQVSVCTRSLATGCGTGSVCVSGSSCASGVCGPDSLCAAPSCSDGVRNGYEACVDGGGSCPSKCASGASCVSGGDCASGVCGGGVCAVPTCSDKVRNGLEAGVDCGGQVSGCGPCGLGAACGVDNDCSSKFCLAGTLTCSLRQSCLDGVMNGDESGVDCGGLLSGCGPCGANVSCVHGSDCASGLCVASTRTCSAAR
jgi:hypothetical protein